MNKPPTPLLREVSQFTNPMKKNTPYSARWKRNFVATRSLIVTSLCTQVWRRQSLEAFLVLNTDSDLFELDNFPACM